MHKNCNLAQFVVFLSKLYATILLEVNKLQTKSQEIKPFLHGRSIYLVGQSFGLSPCAHGSLLKYNYFGINILNLINAGMMGSGKTTVGKILSELLSYSFFDWLVCDSLSF